MFTYMCDLEPLENVLDTFIVEEEDSLFNDIYANEFIETVMHLIDDYMHQYPNVISEPDFRDIILEDIYEIISIQMEDHFHDEDVIEDLIDHALDIYLTSFHPERSEYLDEDDFEDDDIDVGEDEDDIDYELIEKKIQGLRDIPQPVQRTKEWYIFRWNLITASNAWKAFESQSTINQLIYEKCQPLKDFDEPEEIKLVNTNTTLHWGQKYEPLSVMIYEHMFSSKVEDFGCIKHPVYSFIGASPDGIIVESETGRYGRMLEIKNVVSREITGIPKKEYWVQMQLQMEVCDLDECDFLETKFTEYPDFNSYKEDSSKAHINGNVFNSFVTTSDGSYKGIIIHFHAKEGRPHYEYMPLTIWKPDDVSAWEEETIHKYESEPYNYTFIKFIYWKLEVISCVLVERNKEWFKNNVGQLANVWNIIEEERISGYEHRAPTKRKKEMTQPKPFQKNKEVCFLNIIKIDTSNLDTNNLDA